MQAPIVSRLSGRVTYLETFRSWALSQGHYPIFVGLAGESEGLNERSLRLPKRGGVATLWVDSVFFFHN